MLGGCVDSLNLMMVKKRLVFTSDRVGVEIVSGVLRALKDLVNILNAFISSAESESEKSERFIFFRLRL